MIDLRNQEVREAYIAQKTKKLLGLSPQSVDFIDIGVLNYIYKVVAHPETIYFKQGLSRPKKAHLLGQDLASIGYLRIKYERSVVNLLQPAMPSMIALPKIYEYDEENNIIILGDVASGGILLQEALLGSNFNATVAGNIGKFLGLSHRVTYQQGIVIRENKQDDQQHWETLLKMRTKGIQTDEETGRELSKLYEESLQNETIDVLINADCCPKNIFQRDDGSIGVVDFELATGRGDPAYDLGFTLGHYFIFSVLTGNSSRESSRECLNSLLKAYTKEFPKLKGDWLKRVLKYAGAILLYRVSGSSPASYIPPSKVVEFKEKGTDLVLNSPPSLEEVTQILWG